MEEIPAALWISLMIPPYLPPPFTTLPLLVAFHFFISIKLSSLIMMHYEKTSVNCFLIFSSLFLACLHLPAVTMHTAIAPA